MRKPSGFADRYQSVLVPVIFEPWTREMLRRASPRAGEHVLDLACGTGVITRQTAKLAPARLTAVDHSPEMLDVARSLAASAGLDADWVEADAAELPFDDDHFDLALCQQALQFFPNRPAALCELRRVVKPEGRVAFCVQRGLDVNPMLSAQAAALDAHVGKEAGDAVRAICSLSEGSDLRDLFEDAGFQDIEIEAVTLILHHPDAKAFAAGAMGGMHTGDKLSGLANKSAEHAVEAFLTGLAEYLQGPALRFPHSANIVLART
ncbi:class I SAM-dependent methyltransferase [Pseudodonghicola xiamenensis]|uniref:Ubiquinone/menaquinone biosynthesis methyltransferase n=1 Tax=Pseudodonghicola xiamenensis TaxID=337702 RepID=A0A8J3H5Z0_9RHOB|nr:methyltransferase domain-containing protein [Pseudodonghicola xiamenensis]GHG83699.1 ubiquinone/menaquinone biosynthesis methyltransferase [Pseudodonghicola xiamenensis]